MHAPVFTFSFTKLRLASGSQTNAHSQGRRLSYARKLQNNSTPASVSILVTVLDRGNRKALFAHFGCSYWRGNLRVAFRGDCNDFPQSLAGACLGRKVFVASMLTMAVAAVYLALVKRQPNNVGGGFITFYLIGTGWLTARRRDGETSGFDRFALLIPMTTGILT